MQDFNEMAIFAVVVESGSFTKAAEKLKLPKSTVSRKVSQLERRIGVRLINRTTRNLKPTETGKVYHQHCLQMLDHAEEADRAVSNMQSEPTGLLRISTPLAFGVSFFVSVIKSYLDHYPKVAVDIVSDEKEIDLLEEEIDLAFRLGPLSDSSLVTRNLGSVPFVLCSSPEYLAKHGTPQSLDDLNSMECLTHTNATQWVFLDQDNKEMAYDPTSRLVTNDGEMLKNMTIAGMGITVLPRILIQEEINAGKLVPLLQDTPLDERTMYLVYPSRREPPSKVSAFIDYLFSPEGPSPSWELLDGVFNVNPIINHQLKATS